MDSYTVFGFVNWSVHLLKPGIYVVATIIQTCLVVALFPIPDSLAYLTLLTFPIFLLVGPENHERQVA